MAAYAEQRDEDAQVDLKGETKAFARTHGFLATIIAYTGRWLGSGCRSF